VSVVLTGSTQGHLTSFQKCIVDIDLHICYSKDGMARKPTVQEPLYGGITRQQYEWLVARMTSSSDNEASQMCEVSPDTVKYWKNQSTFSTLHNLVLTEPIKALPFLALHLTSKALLTVESLLDSGTVRGMAAGFKAWKELVDIALSEKEQGVEPNVLIQILNARGDIADRILEAAGALGQAALPAPSSPGSSAVPVGPITEEEEWEAVLGRDDWTPVGKDDGGGYSLVDGTTLARRFIWPPNGQADS